MFVLIAGFLKTLERIWCENEQMDGSACGLGFLFLYSLFSGDTRCKAINSFEGYGNSGYGSYGGFGNTGWGSKSSYKKSSSSTGSDSHRFALLLTQLFKDKHSKSLPSSVLNILGRNRQVSLRMPRYRFPSAYFF